MPVEVDRVQAGRARCNDVRGVVVADVQHLVGHKAEGVAHRAECPSAWFRHTQRLGGEDLSHPIQEAEVGELVPLLLLGTVGQDGEVESKVFERREALCDVVESSPCFPVSGEEGRSATVGSTWSR
jgi:hypothetical protein